MTVHSTVATAVLPVQCLLPGPVPAQAEAFVDLQRRPGRPKPPNDRAGEHVWDGASWLWIEFRNPHQLRLTGVVPGARARRGKGEPVSWEVLDRQLVGVAHRWGLARTWAKGASAHTLIANIRAQTWSMACAGQVTLRTPDWLRDRAWMLNASERAVVTLLLGSYERGWGGVFDCQSTIATELGMSERQLRRILNGQSWKLCRCVGDCTHERRSRPGLIERGLVTAVQTWRPPTDPGRRADQSWLLLRVAGQLERTARYHVWAMDWTVRPPRGSGITRKVARRVIASIRKAARASRREDSAQAWSKRDARRKATEDAGEHGLGSVDRLPDAMVQSAGSADVECVLDEQPGELQRDASVVGGPRPVVHGLGADIGGALADGPHAPEASAPGPDASLADAPQPQGPAATPRRACAVYTSDRLTDKPRDQGSPLRGSPCVTQAASGDGGNPRPSKAGLPPPKNDRRPAGVAAGPCGWGASASDASGQDAPTSVDDVVASGPEVGAHREPTDCPHPRVIRGRCVACKARVRDDLGERSISEIFGGRFRGCSVCGKAVCTEHAAELGRT